MLKSFLSFLKFFGKNKTHNMFSLMLDSRFKSLCLVSSFIVVAIVEEYDKKSLLLKCHHHLYPLVETKISFANIGVDDRCSLNIVEKIANTSEPAKRTCEQGAPHF
jgi:hypothetical protein